MPVLNIPQVLHINVNGLGARKPLLSLSQKRITVKIRELLRSQFPNGHVEVSCTANIQNNCWHGTCRINGSQHHYTIM